MGKEPQWETIVGFGCEGSGVTVIGRRRRDGTWELRHSSTSLTLGANDDEEWIETTRPLGSLAEAFESCRRFFGAMVPVDPVHPAFREEMRGILAAITPQPGDVAYASWERSHRQEWYRACDPSDTGDLTSRPGRP